MEVWQNNMQRTVISQLAAERDKDTQEANVDDSAVNKPEECRRKENTSRNPHSHANLSIKCNKELSLFSYPKPPGIIVLPNFSSFEEGKVMAAIHPTILKTNRDRRKKGRVWSIRR